MGNRLLLTQGNGYASAPAALAFTFNVAAGSLDKLVHRAASLLYVFLTFPPSSMR
jgi:hypothetical protein